VRLKHSSKRSSVGAGVVGRARSEPHELLSTLFESSTVGVAICDRRFRYRAINNALAFMNGLPASEHLGKTLYAVLGAAAAKIQHPLEIVFATGRPLSNLEITAELPARTGLGHWIESYFPIKDEAEVVQEVGIIVLELTKRTEIEAALLKIADTLSSISSSLRKDSSALEPSDLSTARAAAVDVIARCLAQLENCMSDVRATSRLLRDAPPSTAVPPSPHRWVAALDPLQKAHRQDFGTLDSIAGEPDCISPLSLREREVISLLAKGKTNKDIAGLLGISNRTVESHRARIMLKLGLDSLSDLVRYAVRTEIIRL
jgi:DNA-binding NarL/FixJ family response regulator